MNRSEESRNETVTSTFDTSGKTIINRFIKLGLSYISVYLYYITAVVEFRVLQPEISSLEYPRFLVTFLFWPLLLLYFTVGANGLAHVIWTIGPLLILFSTWKLLETDRSRQAILFNLLIFVTAYISSFLVIAYFFD
ncbi:MAG: hypothetical protein IH840_00935 [Candidatus Heimdallarchaeota archaeon]|nr:hypothetical protein [Candidatus Heimdallarchaeota archaeon]